jgi:hypothetical protein
VSRIGKCRSGWLNGASRTFHDRIAAAAARADDAHNDAQTHVLDRFSDGATVLAINPASETIPMPAATMKACRAKRQDG